MSVSESETVTLRFPRKSQYYSVVRLVVGGMATPLQMSYDALDDLQLALSSLLDSDDLPNPAASNGLPDGELTLRLRVGADSMSASLGSFDTGSIDGAFQRSEEQGGEFGLRRLLDTIVDDVEVAAQADGEWVTLTKRVKAAV
jgi:anti-sigma regulatory factor (Ser/Thr protein kinase)